MYEGLNMQLRGDRSPARRRSRFDFQEPISLSFGSRGGVSALQQAVRRSNQIFQEVHREQHDLRGRSVPDSGHESNPSQEDPNQRVREDSNPEQQ